MPLGTRHSLTGIWDREADTVDDRLFVAEGGYWRLDLRWVAADPDLIGEVVIIDGVRTGFAALRVLHIRRLEGSGSLLRPGHDF